MRMKLERLLLFLLVLLLPSQLSLHFWPDWSFVGPTPVDLLSPAVYLSDLLLLSLLVVWGTSPQNHNLFRRLRWGKTLGIVVLVILNILLSLSPALAAYKWIRLLSYFGLGVYIFYRARTHQHLIKVSLALSLLWVCVLGLLQFISKSSIGGLWWWLGERTFHLGTSGIAALPLYWHWGGNYLDLGYFLRPYSTFPHPNALAGYLLLSILILYHLDQPLSYSSRLVTTLSHILIFFTFSRPAVLLSLSFIIARSMGRSRLIVFALPLIFIPFLLPHPPSSVAERILLARTSLSVITDRALMGIGLGNFVYLSPLHQPVHNIFLLIGSEAGLIILFVAILILAKSLRSALLLSPYLQFGLLSVTFTGMFDHYWITLPQNQLLLAVFISLAVLESLHHDRNKHLLRRGGSRQPRTGRVSLYRKQQR